MAMTKEALISLALTVAKADPSSKTAFSYGDKNYSYEALDETLRKELNEISGTYSLFRENKNLVFELMERVLTESTPKKVLQTYGQFADVQRFGQGEKAIFRTRITEASKRRGKRFVTKVGLASVYEVFRLDGSSIEVPITAYGGAVQIGFEQYLDGDVSMADVLEVFNEGMEDAVYKEIAKALKTVVTKLPGPNTDSQNGFVETAMDNLLAIADSYGKATIYCTFEFAAQMIPSTGWVSDEQRNRMWDQGYLGNYKGHTVIVLPQSFEDETNTTKVLDPSYAWIIPTGADKPVKIAFEGGACVKSIESNEDWSQEIRSYQKFGVAVVGLNNGICVYQNTKLAPTPSTRVKYPAPGLEAEYSF